ncbi:hypothetical protein [Streptomyces sp. JHA19]|uniref:hypothetical protein n=1 Tax=Streptomyces sp. JHA19 TaxID=1577588 RepID=UPI0006E377EC|nr:hypothetical protein [Streptomyces sp. JHA19]
MGKPNTSKLDREIKLTTRKLEAVRRGEMWPLTGAERSKVMRNLAAGGYRAARGRSTVRAERNLDAVRVSVVARLESELTALQKERQRIVSEAAAARTSKTSFAWW